MEAVMERKQWGEVAGPDAVGVPQGDVVRRLLKKHDLTVRIESVNGKGLFAWLRSRDWSDQDIAGSLCFIAGRPRAVAEGRGWRLMGTRYDGLFWLITIGETG